MRNLWVFLLCLIMSSGVLAEVVLKGNNVTFSFPDVAASFGRPVNRSGEHGKLFLASPLDACSPITINNNSNTELEGAGYVLIVRGGCYFVDKVRRAQAAGFKAAIIYNHRHSELLAMAGDPEGIYIHAVFVSKETGLRLHKYIGRRDMVVWLMKNNDQSPRSIKLMDIFFLLLLGICAILATCFCCRRHLVSHESDPRVRPKFHGTTMSRRLLNAMPTLRFTTALEDSSTSETCAICLEDYNVGDKLRVLPCTHKFHSFCVDAWLTYWRRFCPVCKRDVGSSIRDPPPSDRTPLLSSTPASMTSSSSSL